MNIGWLVVALSAVVLGIGGYAAAVSARRRKLEKRIEELQRSSEKPS